jgi:predicted metalloprotease with PDZ domain
MNIVLRVALRAIAALAAATPMAADAKPVLSLEYRPIMARAGQDFVQMEVTLRFRGDTDGESRVQLPSAWGGETALYRQISQITADGAKLTQSEPALLLLRHRPGAKITLRYRVTGSPRPDQLADGETANAYRPIINRDYFHLLGETVIAQPEHIAPQALAQFSIKGMPRGVSFATDMEHAALLPFADLIESLAVGGDFRIVQAGAKARLAIRGRFAERDDDGWRKAFAATTSAITGYWESDTGPYLVTVLPFAPSAPGSVSVGGTGRSDAFAFFATTNAVTDTIDTIMAHEMTHSWVPRRIGGMPREGDETESYWLTEGFTDFATYRALVRSGA